MIKNSKNAQFFSKKCYNFLILRPLWRAFKLKEKPPIPQKEHKTTKNSFAVFVFLKLFLPSLIRINSRPNWIWIRDPKHCIIPLPHKKELRCSCDRVVSYFFDFINFFFFLLCNQKGRICKCVVSSGNVSSLVQQWEESRFFLLFCLMIEGSGSKRPKNIWIRQIQIRIRNTA